MFNLAIRRPLPTSFRITGNSTLVDVVRKYVETYSKVWGHLVGGVLVITGIHRLK